MLRRLGFDPIEDVHGLVSAAHLLPAQSRRTGLYVLHFANGLFYIGQAKDAVRRFTQHRKRWKDIADFGFQRVHRRELDAQEQRLIARAEAMGLPLTNRVFVSHTNGESDLDELLSQELQKLWLKRPLSAIKTDLAVRFGQRHPQRIRFLQQYEEFREAPGYSVALSLLRQYVCSCLPIPLATQYSFWSLSAMPATNRNYWPRLIVINVGSMETFVIGYHKDNATRLWGFLTVSRSDLRRHFGSIQQLRSTIPGLTVAQRHYRSAGPDQITLHAKDGRVLQMILSRAGVRSAARHLNLNVMRKGPTLYSQFHCPDLTDEILGKSANSHESRE